MIGAASRDLRCVSWLRAPRFARPASAPVPGPTPVVCVVFSKATKHLIATQDNNASLLRQPYPDARFVTLPRGRFLTFSEFDQGVAQILGHAAVSELLGLSDALLVGGAGLVLTPDLLQRLAEP